MGGEITAETERNTADVCKIGILVVLLLVSIWFDRSQYMLDKMQENRDIRIKIGKSGWGRFFL